MIRLALQSPRRLRMVQVLQSRLLHHPTKTRLRKRIHSSPFWVVSLDFHHLLLPLQMLSGGITPSESMPEIVQHLMQAAPTTHFVSLSKAILFRGAGIEVVWQSLMALLLIGIVLYILALGRFRKTINTME